MWGIIDTFLLLVLIGCFGFGGNFLLETKKSNRRFSLIPFSIGILILIFFWSQIPTKEQAKESREEYRTHMKKLIPLLAKEDKKKAIEYIREHRNRENLSYWQYQRNWNQDTLSEIQSELREQKEIVEVLGK